MWPFVKKRVKKSSLLRVTIEHSWRGSILDTVTPLSEFELSPHESARGVLSIGGSRSITSIDGESVSVWCSKTLENNQVHFSVSHKELTLFKLSTERNFYLELVLPDGKQYQFEFEDNDL